MARTAATSPSPSEVAVLTGVLPNGGTIPLPIYADGTVATESECHWTVSANTFLYQFGGHVYCRTDGRTVYLVSEGGQNDPSTYANYMIVASRGAPLAVSSEPKTWGKLKASYR